MRQELTVSAEPRSARGKNEARRLRERGMIPAIVYGAFQAPVAVAVNPKEIGRILHSKTGHNTIFNIGIRDGETTPAMLVDWQYDPMRDTLLHVDLKRIDLTKRIRVNVPVFTEGDPKGVKQQDGLLEVVTREVEIECLPNDIPEHFTLDVTELLIGQAVRASDLALPEGLKLLTSGDNVIAHVVALRAVEEAAPAVAPEAAAAPEAGAAASEPEVIKRAKKEEEAEAEKKKK